MAEESTSLILKPVQLPANVLREEIQVVTTILHVLKKDSQALASYTVHEVFNDIPRSSLASGCLSSALVTLRSNIDKDAHTSLGDVAYCGLILSAVIDFLESVESLQLPLKQMSAIANVYHEITKIKEENDQTLIHMVN